MKESKHVVSLVITVALLALSASAVASAGELKGRSEKVTYSDLNVAKETGASTLYRRLQQAAKRVCGVESIKNAGGVRAIAAQKRCYNTALDAAVAKVDSAVLTEIHEG